MSDVVFHTISVLLEQGCCGNIYSRSIATLWHLMGIVLSNIFKGDNITTLIAPRSTTKLEKFDQLLQLDFSYFVSFQSLQPFCEMCDLEQQMQKLFPEVLPNSTVDLQIKTDSILNPLCQNNTTTFDSIKSLIQQVAAHTDLKNIHWPPRSFELRKWVDPKSYLPRLAKCGRQAYDGHFREVTMMSQLLLNILVKQSKSQKVVVVSKDSFAKVGPTWYLRNVPVPSSYLFTYVHLLWQSGLTRLWEDWSLRIEMWNTTRDTEIMAYRAKLPISFSLKDNGVVFFYLYLCIIVISILAFWMELRWVDLLSWMFTVLRELPHKIRMQFDFATRKILKPLYVAFCGFTRHMAGPCVRKLLKGILTKRT